MYPAAIARAQAESGCVFEPDARGGLHRVDCPDFPAKVALLDELARQDARDDGEVRRVATHIAEWAGSREPAAIAPAIHAYVRDHVPYVPEEVETFQASSGTLEHGGDCDCKTRLVLALARALGVEGRLNAREGSNGTQGHCYPELWDGSAFRIAETTIAARFGEEPVAALRRLRAAGLMRGGVRSDLGELGGATSDLGDASNPLANAIAAGLHALGAYDLDPDALKLAQQLRELLIIHGGNGRSLDELLQYTAWVADDVAKQTLRRNFQDTLSTRGCVWYEANPQQGTCWGDPSQPGVPGKASSAYWDLIGVLRSNLDPIAHELAGTPVTTAPAPGGVKISTSLSADALARLQIVAAWKTVAKAPPATPAAVQAFQSICRFETFYGKGWLTAEGKASNNMGADQCGIPKGGVCAAGTFQNRDTHADGTPYAACFCAHATPVEGFAAVLRILVKDGAAAVLGTGDARRIASAMKRGKYFEASVAKYSEAMTKNAAAIAAKLNEPVLVKNPPAWPAVVSIVLGAGGVGAAIWYTRRKAARRRG